VRLLDLDEELAEPSPVATPPEEGAPEAAMNAATVPEPTDVATAAPTTPQVASAQPTAAAAEPALAASMPPSETVPTHDAVAKSQPAPSPPSRAVEPRSSETRAPKTPRTNAVQARLPVSPSSDNDPLDAMPSLRPSRSGSNGDYQRTGHPVRDRLMAKAAEVTKSQDPPSAGEGSSGAFSALRGMEAELEQLAGPRQKLVSEPVRVGKAVLSPTTTLVAITFIGLAAISSLFLLLAKFAPKTPPDAAAVALAPVSPAPTLVNPDPNATLDVVLPPPVAPPERKREAGPWRIGAAEGGQRLIRGTVGSNPFLKAIEAAGIDKNQAYRVYAALKPHKDFDHCRPKDEFVALVNRADKRLVAFEYIVSKEEVYQARETDGKLVGKPLDLKVSKHRVQGSILMTSAGFGAAVQNAGLESSIGEVVNRALSGHTNVSQFRAGDRLRIVAQEVTVLGEFYRYAGIEALEYIPVEGDPVRIYYHAAKRQYYDAKGRAPGEGGWRSPVRGAPITSKFNPQRMHPILKKKMPHNGTDFGAPTGTPIYAASYGKISKHGNYGANGNYIAIEHDNGYETGYSHLSRFEPGLKVGDSVKRSQVIGYVGSTGRSTGPHLHFSARKNGAYIDAETLHLDALTVLPAAERAIFQGVKEKYDALLEAVALPPALPPQLVASAPAAAAPQEDMEGEGPDGDLPGALPPSSPTPAIVMAQPNVVAQVPLAPPGTPLQGAPQAVPLVAAPSPAAPGGGFFLSDKDLLQNQPAVDDGEVDE
jgi:murein DD-endopeptidase MepM/ murein hydrolase activator NlpD